MGEHCILVIEDQEDLAELYEATLRKAGYNVRIALTGEGSAAWTVVRAQTVSISIARKGERMGVPRRWAGWAC